MVKALRIILPLLLIAGAVIGIYVYQKYINGPKIPSGLSSYIVTIPDNSSYEEVLDSLQKKGFVEDAEVFTLFAKRMNYVRNPMRAGRYEVKPGWSMIELIRHLRSNAQAPVKLILHNERLPEQIAAKAARFIQPDSLEIWTFLNDPQYLESIGYERETITSLFIPNTYEFFWNTSPKGFVERMISEHEKFWNQNGRTARAEQMGLSPKEVYTLASIVEKETLVAAERPKMAGVYLNRLRIGMPLQADPTAVFARRDFDTPRVTDYHTKYDSPYNTYMYAGLPPGPISMASIGSIDAVLNAADHDYLYFCAVGDGSGLHNFAKTLAAHNRNAAIYRQNLKERGLR
jgi:UPF0755 protein